MLTNRDALKKYVNEIVDGKPQKLINYYLLLGYNEIDSFNKALDYLRRKKKYTMLRRLERILILMGYYRPAKFDELFYKKRKDKHGKNRKFIRQRFITYINCCDFNEWLEMEYKGALDGKNNI